MIPCDPEGDNLVPLSALNAFLFCNRRAALRHLDNLYVHNEHTLRGDSLHKRADRPGFEKRKGVRTERGLWIASIRLRLYGRADLVEFRREPGRKKPGVPVVEIAYPVGTNAAAHVAGTTTMSNSAPRRSAWKRCWAAPFQRAPSITPSARSAAMSPLLRSYGRRPKTLLPSSMSCSLRTSFPRRF